MAGSNVYLHEIGRINKDSCNRCLKVIKWSLRCEILMPFSITSHMQGLFTWSITVFDWLKSLWFINKAARNVSQATLSFSNIIANFVQINLGLFREYSNIIWLDAYCIIKQVSKKSDLWLKSEHTQLPWPQMCAKDGDQISDYSVIWKILLCAFKNAWILAPPIFVLMNIQQ